MLDEPTNDLDIDTLELLESLLQDFPGTLFLVSHDRAFLENTVTQVIAFEGKGQLTEFGGGYDDWRRYTEQRSAEAKTARDLGSAKPAIKTSLPKADVSKPAANKLSFKENKELEEITAAIEKQEIEQANITLALADPAIYSDRTDEAQSLQASLEKINSELERLLARWEALESRR